MKLIGLHLLPPSFLGDIDELSLSDVISDLPEAMDVDVVNHRIHDRAEFQESWSEVIASTAPHQLTILFIAGHGRSKQISGRTEKLNLLYTRDTDKSEESITSINLDNAIEELSQQSSGNVFLVVDACDIDLRDRRNAGPNSTVALLANPGGAAEAVKSGGILSRCFVRNLTSGCRRGEPLQKIANSTMSQVKLETNARQQPRLVKIGRATFLEEPLQAPPQLFGYSQSGQMGMEQAVIKLATTVDFPASVLNALTQGLPTEPEDEHLLELRIALTLQHIKPASGRPTPDRIHVEELEHLLHLARRVEIGRDTLLHARHMLGWAYYRLDDKHKASAQLHEALQQTEGAQDQMSLRARLLDTLGMVAANEANFSQARTHYHHSLELKELLNDLVGIEMSRQNLGWAEFAEGEFEHAEKHMERGVDICLDRLENPCVSTAKGPEQFQLCMATLDSLVFHLFGLLTLMLLRNAPCSEFTTLQERCQNYLDLYEHLSAWGSTAPYTLVRLLIAIATDTAPITKADPTEDASALVNLWRLVAICNREGTAVLRNLQDITTTNLESSDLRLRLSCLAAASYLCQSLESQQAGALLDETLKTLRRQHGFSGLPRRSNALIKQANPTALRLDTSHWPVWGPLKAQTRASQLEGIFLNPSITEKYLQVFAWCSALITCHEGRVSLRQALDILHKHFPDGTVIHLGLGQALLFSNIVAKPSKPTSTWGEELKEMWSETTFLEESGYKNFQDIAEERNVITHYRNMTTSEAQLIIDKHCRIIHCLARPLQEMDSLHIVPAERGLHSHTQLREAVLRDSRGNAFNCGPLLLINPSRHEEFYIPHRLDRQSLKGQDPTQPSTYRRYGDAIHETDDFSEKITWQPVDTGRWRKR